VFGKKFFNGKSLFHGFNMGQGKFRVFSFGEPPSQDEKIDMMRLDEEKLDDNSSSFY